MMREIVSIYICIFSLPPSLSLCDREGERERGDNGGKDADNCNYLFSVDATFDALVLYIMHLFTR